MVRIAVCDDTGQDRELLCSHIFHYFGVRGEAQYIAEYSSGDSFLKNMRAYHYDIVFFDVEMPGTDGIEAAKRLREIDKMAVIIFTTVHAEQVFSSFAAEPLQYLVKPVGYGELAEVMERAMDKLAQLHSESFVLTFNNALYKIPLAEILYFESRGRVVYAVTQGDEYPFYAKLREIEAKLTKLVSHNFLRCHQSYLVNSQYIRRIEKDSILLSNGKSVELSRVRKKAVKDKFLAYMEDLMP